MRKASRDSALTNGPPTHERLLANAEALKRDPTLRIVHSHMEGTHAFQVAKASTEGVE